MRLNTRHTIERHVQAPLETLIDEAMLAYKKQKPLDEDIFSTKEFSAVANEINLFNSEIIANQDLLRSKNEELIALNNEIESTLRETVYTMGVIEEQRSKETNNHTRRVTLYSRFLAQQAGLSAQDVDLITTASPLHDIGKLGIPDEILFKPGQLTPEERQVMEHHTRIGYTMLCHSQRSILKAGAIVALQHHEKWDGSGYPQKLKGEAIHIYGRIVAVADVFDALYSERIYKESWPIEKIVAFFKQERGRHFDPEMTDIFLNNTEAFVAIYQQHPSTSLPES
ncbi:MAG TPA: HD domain-containing protein [Candidatus Tenderia sp.]|nr:HD domain-containing protein [Candidatus Tenderia sp.]